MWSSRGYWALVAKPIASAASTAPACPGRSPSPPRPRPPAYRISFNMRSNSSSVSSNALQRGHAAQHPIGGAACKTEVPVGARAPRCALSPAISCRLQAAACIALVAQRLWIHARSQVSSKGHT